MSGDPLPAIRALPAKALNELSAALRGGHLDATASTLAIRKTVPAVSDAAAAELCGLLASGLELSRAALFLGALAAEQIRHGNISIELVTSGPDAIGATRDTGVILRELFAAAERRVLVVGFAVHQGREVFAVLAHRMTELPDLPVRLCLDIRRAPGDTAREDAIIRRFAERFIRQEWPGARLPEVFYDPRSLADADGQRASLHAKCIVVDGNDAFIGSANFTQAAQSRNIEVGVIVHDPEIAIALERHFEALIAHDYLRALSLPL